MKRTRKLTFFCLVGWTAQPEAGFGNEQGQTIKYKMINLISAVRTLMRSKVFFYSIHIFTNN